MEEKKEFYELFLGRIARINGDLWLEPPCIISIIISVQLLDLDLLILLFKQKYL